MHSLKGQSEQGKKQQRCEMLANLEAGKQLKTWHSEERNPKPIYSVESQKGTEM